MSLVSKNGDFFGVVYEAIQLVGKNSPLGRAIKAAQAAVEFSSFMVKVNRIWNKIDSFAETAIEQMWDIVKKYPEALRINPDLIGGIAKAINRGIKSIDEVMESIPGFTKMSSQRMKHILHGDAGGGLHHASGLVNNSAINVIEHIPPNAKGVYKIRYELPNGQTKLSSMFPDSKSEIGVAKSIENVFNNPSEDIIDGVGRKLTGTDSAGIPIEIITDSNYNIITAYPLFN